MTGFNISQFDQTLFLFFVFSALGLIRERTVLPFVLAVIGVLFFGPVAATLLAALILWSRIESKRSKWIQLKDGFGFILLMIASVSPEPLQQFCAVMGCLFISFSFGLGGLGVLPAALLVRQYVPHPPSIEVTWIGFAVYLSSVEIIRWAKLKREALAVSISDSVCSLILLYGLKDFVIRVIEEPALTAIGASILVLTLIVFSWLRWKGDSFWRFYKKSTEILSQSMLSGKKFVSDQVWGSNAKPEILEITNESVFDRVFLLTILLLFVLLGFSLAFKGGWL